VFSFVGRFHFDRAYTRSQADEIELKGEVQLRAERHSFRVPLPELEIGKGSGASTASQQLWKIRRPRLDLDRNYNFGVVILRSVDPRTDRPRPHLIRRERNQDLFSGFPR